MNNLCNTCIGNKFCSRLVKSRVKNKCHKYKPEKAFIDTTQPYFSVYYLVLHKGAYGMSRYIYEEMRFNSKTSATTLEEIKEKEYLLNRRSNR